MCIRDSIGWKIVSQPASKFTGNIEFTVRIGTGTAKSGCKDVYKRQVLIGLLQNSIKGNYIYMSATLTNQPDLLMTKRYHGYLLDLSLIHI